MNTIRRIIRSFKPEESDIYLCIGVESLFFGVSLVHLPAAIILMGAIFCALAYATAPAGGA